MEIIWIGGDGIRMISGVSQRRAMDGSGNPECFQQWSLIANSSEMRRNCQVGQ